jgi:predicted cupin superfamily sugar epimerase
MPVIAANWWQVARSRGIWSLVDCTVAPGLNLIEGRRAQGDGVSGLR